jgi:hypothetical protein
MTSEPLTDFPTVRQVFAHMLRHPGQVLLRDWNWKAAFVSAAIRATIYLVTSLKAGWRAGLFAMAVEAIYRVPLSGLCGSFIQAFRHARPKWAATFTVMVCLPIAMHSVELAIHWLQGAPRLWLSLSVSVIFTIVAARFNLYAMRRGAYVVGREGRSFITDLQHTPAIIGGFLASGPLALYRALRGLVA